MKKSLEILIWIAVSVALIFLLSFAEANHRQTICNDICISIDCNETDTLILPGKILGAITRNCDTIIGKPIHTINIRAVGSSLSKFPCIANCNTYTDMEGRLNVHIKQRKPVMRIITKDQKSYYVDGKGIVFPADTQGAARVMIINGNIPAISIPAGTFVSMDSLAPQGTFQAIREVTGEIMNRELLKALIEQIYITNNNEFEFIPKIGRQVIEFGLPERTEQKLDYLVAFYREGIPKAGWNTYKTINLTYNHQIVCSK